jgi:O-acetyl-ADP-ribose deacetylase (regulator of RNase III)
MIHYRVGDATDLDVHDRDQKVLAHICNDRGGWARGFVLAVSKRWMDPEEEYRAWAQQEPGMPEFGLGRVQLVRVSPWICVANMVAQRGYATKNRPRPLEYDALRECLRVLAYEIRLGPGARFDRVTIHMPRIGTGLAGGSWDQIEPLILAELADYDVHVYDLPS